MATLPAQPPPDIEIGGKRTKTAYVVLQLIKPEITSDPPPSVNSGDRTEQWSVVARSVEAASSEAAVKWYGESSEIAGMYVAVPARSWQPTAVKVETQTIVKVG